MSGFVDAKSYDPFYGVDEKPTELFDVVTAFEVIEHVPDPHSVFGIVKSFLKEDSLFLFSTLLQPKEIEHVGVEWWYVAPRNGHVALHTFASLKLVSAQHGLKFGTISPGLHVACKAIPVFASHSFNKKNDPKYATAQSQLRTKMPTRVIEEVHFRRWPDPGRPLSFRIFVLTPS